MLINLKHQSLDIYQATRELVKDIYQISNRLPSEERFNMVQQIRRAGLSIKLNLAEGSSRKSQLERNRFFEISRGSLIEVDAILETDVDLKYLVIDELKEVGLLMNKCFAMLSKMMK
jgi:four helix bundle protein